MIKKLNIAIIGSNFGVKIHAPAFEQTNLANIFIYNKDNWKEALTDHKIDAVSIALPPSKSFEVIKEAILYNKHIFCEKPLTDTLLHAQELYQLLPEHLITAINFEICEATAVKTLRNIIKYNKYGKIEKFNLEWRSSTSYIKEGHSWKLDANKGGGALGNFCSHALHLLEFIFNEHIGNLSGKCNINQNINTEVSAKINFQSFNGKLYIDCDTNEKSHLFIRIKCERATILLENNSNKLTNFILTINNIIEKTTDNDLNQDARIPLISALAKSFINGILFNYQITPNLSDGVRIQKYLDILLRGSA